MLLRTAICDDDKNDAERIRSFLVQYEMQYDVDFEVTVFGLPGEMLAAYPAPGAFHLAFLDVEMPGMNGIQLAEALRNLEDHKLRIVFVSNYPRYMQDSFPVHPVHYLTKPLAYHEFAKVMGQVLQELESSGAYKTLVQADGREELAAHHFFSPHRGILLNLNCIHYLDEDTVTLLGGTVLPLSRRKSRELHARLSRRLIQFEQD